MAAPLTAEDRIQNERFEATEKKRKETVGGNVTIDNLALFLPMAAASAFESAGLVTVTGGPLAAAALLMGGPARFLGVGLPGPAHYGGEYEGYQDPATGRRVRIDPSERLPHGSALIIPGATTREKEAERAAGLWRGQGTYQSTQLFGPTVAYLAANKGGPLNTRDLDKDSTERIIKSPGGFAVLWRAGYLSDQFAQEFRRRRQDIVKAGYASGMAYDTLRDLGMVEPSPSETDVLTQGMAAPPGRSMMLHPKLEGD